MKGGEQTKCVIWDLDDTLWNGILLENAEVVPNTDILEGIRLLDSRGILQSVASKNDYSAAMAKIEELDLTQFFLFPQIGWQSKSSMVREIQKELGVRTDSLMLIDDQPFERDEVKSMFPDMQCLHPKPSDRLWSLPCLNPQIVTVDATRRRAMYLDYIRRRQAEREHVGPADSFLEALDMRLTIRVAGQADYSRAAELTQRTSQLNATGASYTEGDLRACVERGDRLIACDLEDRYGSYGTIGILLLELAPKRCHLKLLLVSCRVLNRGIGANLLQLLIQACRESGSALTAAFRSTGKNRAMEICYRFANFRTISSEGSLEVLANDLSTVPALPSYIQVDKADALSFGP